MPDAVSGIAAEAVRSGAWHLVQVRTHGPCGCKASKCLQPAAQNLFLQVCALAGLSCGTSVPGLHDVVPVARLGPGLIVCQYLNDVQAADRLIWL